MSGSWNLVDIYFDLLWDIQFGAIVVLGLKYSILDMMLTSN